MHFTNVHLLLAETFHMMHGLLDEEFTLSSTIKSSDRTLSFLADTYLRTWMPTTHVSLCIMNIKIA